MGKLEDARRSSPVRAARASALRSPRRSLARVRVSCSPIATLPRRRARAAALGDAAIAFDVDVTREARGAGAWRGDAAPLRPHRHPRQQRRHHAQGVREGHDARRLWDAVVDVNLKATFLCSKAVLPAMIDARRGRIINIASIAGKVGEPTASAYSAAKFGVHRLHALARARSRAPRHPRQRDLPGADSDGARPAGMARWRRRAGRRRSTP